MSSAREHARYLACEAALYARGFSRVHFDLNKVKRLLELLGDPQKSFRAVHITGTNGKTSTARMTESLVRAHGLRTGRYTSPHLDSVRERITIDGEPIGEVAFTELYEEIEPYVRIVDGEYEESLTFFDVTTAMAFAAFADAPVDVAVVEVGAGGETDATNVLSAAVAIITPIGLDHTEWLGDNVSDIAHIKSGIVHQGSTLVSSAQDPEAMVPLVERCHAVGASLVAEGRRFSVDERRVAVGGQQLTITGPSGATYESIFLPLHGGHQAHNAAAALAAVEILLGAGQPKALSGEIVGEGFASSTSPGRLERVRSAPTVLLDAAHNPSGMTATVAAIEEEFTFSRLIGVVGVFGDKDAVGMLRLLRPILDRIVITQSSAERARPALELAEIAWTVFEREQVIVEPDLREATETAIRLAEDAEDVFGGAGVLVTGSVYTVADARKLFVSE